MTASNVVVSLPLHVSVPIHKILIWICCSLLFQIDCNSSSCAILQRFVSTAAMKCSKSGSFGSWNGVPGVVFLFQTSCQTIILIVQRLVVLSSLFYVSGGFLLHRVCFRYYFQWPTLPSQNQMRERLSASRASYASEEETTSSTPQGSEIREASGFPMMNRILEAQVTLTYMAWLFMPLSSSTFTISSNWYFSEGCQRQVLGPQMAQVLYWLINLDLLSSCWISP